MAWWIGNQNWKEISNNYFFDCLFIILPSSAGSEEYSRKISITERRQAQNRASYQIFHRQWTKMQWGHFPGNCAEALWKPKADHLKWKCKHLQEVKWRPRQTEDVRDERFTRNVWPEPQPYGKSRIQGLRRIAYKQTWSCCLGSKTEIVAIACLYKIYDVILHLLGAQW